MKFESPDKKHCAEFTHAGEIRFGPHYFHLSISNRDFGERIFGDTCLWSDDSCYAAVQEWLTDDESNGPITSLVLINVVDWKETTLTTVNKGWVVPKKFSGNDIIYTKEYYTPEKSAKEYEINYRAHQNWKKIMCHPE